MKRVNNLYDKIICIENLNLADKLAQKGKQERKDVLQHNSQRDSNIQSLFDLLNSQEYVTSKYQTFTIHEPKERKISKLPYFPDRIVHHAIVNVIGHILIKSFVADTYSCIKGRGIHKASYNLRKSLLDIGGTKYCLKLDIRKFYYSIDKDILKLLLRRKFKDQRLLKLLDEIIDSSPEGVPLGSILSQYFANFYLTYFDHYLKEKLRLKHYFRYADDMVILSDSKESLRSILNKIEVKLSELKLKIKHNYQIFPVEDRGIDFVGYKHYHTHVLLRKSIKENYKRCRDKKNYNGWLKHANTINLRSRYE